MNQTVVKGGVKGKSLNWLLDGPCLVKQTRVSCFGNTRSGDPSSMGLDSLEVNRTTDNFPAMER